MTPSAESSTGAVEDLAARHVGAERVDLALAALEAEGEVGLVADDPHLSRPVEVLGDPLHLLAQRLPVDQHRAVEEVLERAGAACPASWADRGGRVVAADPRLLVGQERHRAARAALPAGRRPARPGCPRRSRCSPGRRSRCTSPRCSISCSSMSAELVDQLHRRFADERAADRVEARRTSARAPRRASSRAISSISGRAGGWERTSTCQPGSGVDAVDQHARVRLDPRVAARDPSRAWRARASHRPSRRRRWRSAGGR